MVLWTTVSKTIYYTPSLSAPPSTTSPSPLTHRSLKPISLPSLLLLSIHWSKGPLSKLKWSCHSSVWYPLVAPHSPQNNVQKPCPDLCESLRFAPPCTSGQCPATLSLCHWIPATLAFPQFHWVKLPTMPWATFQLYLHWPHPPLHPPRHSSDGTSSRRPPWCHDQSWSPPNMLPGHLTHLPLISLTHTWPPALWLPSS